MNSNFLYKYSKILVYVSQIYKNKHFKNMKNISENYTQAR